MFELWFVLSLELCGKTFLSKARTTIKQIIKIKMPTAAAMIILLFEDLGFLFFDLFKSHVALGDKRFSVAYSVNI